MSHGCLMWQAARVWWPYRISIWDHNSVWEYAMTQCFFYHLHVRSPRGGWISGWSRESWITIWHCAVSLCSFSVDHLCVCSICSQIQILDSFHCAITMRSEPCCKWAQLLPFYTAECCGIFSHSILLNVVGYLQLFLFQVGSVVRLMSSGHV